MTKEDLIKEYELKKCIVDNTPRVIPNNKFLKFVCEKESKLISQFISDLKKLDKESVTVEKGCDNKN